MTITREIPTIETQSRTTTTKTTEEKKIKDDDDDDDTIMTKITQESSLECKEIECNLIDDENGKYNNHIIIIPTQVLFRMKHDLNWKSKRKQKWQKEKYIVGN